MAAPSTPRLGSVLSGRYGYRWLEAGPLRHEAPDPRTLMAAREAVTGLPNMGLVMNSSDERPVLSMQSGQVIDPGVAAGLGGAEDTLEAVALLVAIPALRGPGPG